MVIVQLKKWLPIKNLELLSVTWKVTYDEAGENIIEEHKNSNMLEVFYSGIEIPKDTTYYVFAQRHFNRQSLDFWTSAIPVTNNQEEITNMMFGKDPVIEQPYIYVTKEDILAGTEMLTLKSSQFRSNTDEHDSSHFFIFDSSDKLIYSALNVKQDKLSFQIPNLADYKTRDKLKFGIIHRGISGCESKLGLKTVDIYTDYGYNISSSLFNIPPLNDYTINFVITNGKDKLQINKVELVDSVTKEKITSLEKLNNTQYKIPGVYLTSGVNYKLHVLVANLFEVKNESRYHDISVMAGTDSIIKSEDYKYVGQIDEFEATESDLVPEGIFVESLYNGIILIPNVVTYVFDYYTSGQNKSGKTVIKKTDKFAIGIPMLNSNIQNMFIKPLTKELVLIDMLDNNNKPTFYLYNYNINSDTFTIKSKLTREDETECVGKTLAILQISDSEVIYNPIGTNKLKSYNIFTNKLTDLPNIPLEGTTKTIFCRGRNNRVFIGNSKDYQACVYNFGSLEYTQGYVFSPVHFVNKTLKTVPLINGSSLIINLDIPEEENQQSLEIFDYKKGVLSLVDYTFKDNFPFTTIVDQYGNVVLVSAALVEGTKEISTTKQYYRIYY